MFCVFYRFGNDGRFKTLKSDDDVAFFTFISAFYPETYSQYFKFSSNFLKFDYCGMATQFL